MLTITISLGWRGRRPASEPADPSPDPVPAPDVTGLPAPRVEHLHAPAVQADDADPDGDNAALYMPGTDPTPGPHHH
jgi:hypothetical protein